MWIGLVPRTTWMRERRNGHLDHARDGPHAFELARRGDREARLDHVDPEALDLRGHLRLLVGAQRDARRLLAVAQGRVENSDPSKWHVVSSSVASVRRRTSGVMSVGVCALAARGRVLPLEGENDDDEENEAGRYPRG